MRTQGSVSPVCEHVHPMVSTTVSSHIWQQRGTKQQGSTRAADRAWLTTAWIFIVHGPFSFLSKLKRLMFDYLFGWASLKAWAQWTILITVDSASCPLFSLALGAILTRKYWKSTNTTSLAYNPMSAAQINHLYTVYLSVTSFYIYVLNCPGNSGQDWQLGTSGPKFKITSFFVFLMLLSTDTCLRSVGFQRHWS